jgi:predicted negative regulator of RcsB-dependent stress response
MSWWETTVVIGAGVLTIVNLIDKIVTKVKEAKEPTQDLEKRVADLERKILESYDKRIEDIEKGNKVTQRAILALLEHAIDGNNKNQLIKAKDNLNDYLTDR